MPNEGCDAISILYEEPHFLLVNKPSGLFSQAAPGVDSLQLRLALHLKRRDAHQGQPFIGLPHRLDCGTSGIMLIARNQRALKRFGEQFQNRVVRKFYAAVVEGDAPDGEQIWDDYLRKIPDQPKTEVVSRDIEGAKRASATATCMEREAGLSLLLVEIKTGRMHQIRIQAASRGFPVLGDAAYGAQRAFQTVSETAAPHGHPPVALHALRLEFRHPQTAKQLRMAAPVPDYWDRLPPSIAMRARDLSAH